MTEQNDEQKGCGTSEKKYVNKNNIELHTGGSRLYQRRFLQPNTHFAGFFEIYSRPYRAKKKCKHFSSPEKKIHLAESCGCGALAANVGPPGRPWGYQRLTLGQPSVNPRSTLGQRSVNVGYLP